MHHGFGIWNLTVRTSPQPAFSAANGGFGVQLRLFIDAAHASH
jgi:hypothetical protein